jgi:hypothetical protein
MSFTWAADWRGDDEPSGVHSLACLIWKSPDPIDGCDCGATDFQAGVQQKLDRFESYAGRSS